MHCNSVRVYRYGGELTKSSYSAHIICSWGVTERAILGAGHLLMSAQRTRHLLSQLLFIQIEGEGLVALPPVSKAYVHSWKHSTPLFGCGILHFKPFVSNEWNALQYDLHPGALTALYY